MGVKAQTIHGSRAKLIIDGKPVGIFNSVSYGLAYDMQPIYLMGRFSPAEIVPTGQEAIAVTATGFRIYNRGPHTSALLPALQELLQHEDISLSIIDRQNASGKPIMTVVGVRPTGFSTGLSARGVQEITVNFIGLRVSDESVDNEESPGASDIGAE